MLTDPKLRAQVDALWDKFWTGGLSNPLDAIEQFSYLLFLKRLDDRENAAERQAKRRGETDRGAAALRPYIPKEMRWGYWTQMKAEEALSHLKNVVFPGLVELADVKSSFGEYMKGAQCKINKAGLLIEACNLIDQMKIAEQNQDVQGDLYEYMLGHMQFAGRGGQFRTPRHIIRMMVQMMDPKPRERIGDLAGGTGGFLVNAHQYILEKHTSAGILEYDAEGQAHHLIGDQLSATERSFMSTKKYLRGFDNDSGMTILRIGSMNLMLHGIESPQFYYMDSLSKSFDDEREYDVILMNPPFKGAVDKGGVHPTLPSDTTKSELLFLHLILRALDMGGRAAVIVPDGVLFGSSRAHVEVRRRIIEENRLDGVVSMPSGVFKPYAGVSTAVLFFTRGAQTKDIWFYDMAHDGFSLDDKRVAIDENDIPDVVNCWEKRNKKNFKDTRNSRIEKIRKTLKPLKDKRMKLHEEINRLQFEIVLDKTYKLGNRGSSTSLLAKAKSQLNNIDSRISSSQSELDHLTRQFWVTKEQVIANNYDLTASRYCQIETDMAYSEESLVDLERLSHLGKITIDSVERRRADTEKIIQGATELLKSYERQYFSEIDPQIKLSAKNNIDRLKQLIDINRSELNFIEKIGSQFVDKVVPRQTIISRTIIPERQLRVFLCHSSHDKSEVRKLYNQLRQEKDIDPWLDEEKILPGEDWDLEISRAIKVSDVVIVCLSGSSVSKEGYVQKEIRQAIDIADEKPDGIIFIIPLKLENCTSPDRLNRWHWLNYYDESAHEKLLKSLRKRAQTLGIENDANL